MHDTFDGALEEVLTSSRTEATQAKKIRELYSPTIYIILSKSECFSERLVVER